MVIAFRVSCKAGALPHEALATAVVAFGRGDVSPYYVPTRRTGPSSIAVVVRCIVGVESTGCKFSF